MYLRLDNRHRGKIFVIDGTIKVAPEMHTGVVPFHADPSWSLTGKRLSAFVGS
jgi:hypothetical protein